MLSKGFHSRGLQQENMNFKSNIKTKLDTPAEFALSLVLL